MAALLMFLALSGCGCDKIAKADSIDAPYVSVVLDESDSPVVVMLRDSAEPDCPSETAGMGIEPLSSPVEPSGEESSESPADSTSDPLPPVDRPTALSSSPQIVLEQAEDIEDDLDEMLERLRTVRSQQQGERNEAQHEGEERSFPPG
jgi:hypothetical protein